MCVWALQCRVESVCRSFGAVTLRYFWGAQTPKLTIDHLIASSSEPALNIPGHTLIDAQSNSILGLCSFYSLFRGCRLWWWTLSRLFSAFPPQVGLLSSSFCGSEKDNQQSSRIYILPPLDIGRYIDLDRCARYYSNGNIFPIHFIISHGLPLGVYKW